MVPTSCREWMRRSAVRNRGEIRAGTGCEAGLWGGVAMASKGRQPDSSSSSCLDGNDVRGRLGCAQRSNGSLFLGPVSSEISHHLWETDSLSPDARTIRDASEASRRLDRGSSENGAGFQVIEKA